MSEQITLLISREDMIPYCQVAIHSREDSMLQPHILAAQLVDVKQMLGNALYTDLIKNRTDAKYITLLEGGEYTVDGKVLTFQGLKAAISCYAYARYILRNNVVDTPFGMVNKTSEFSEPADSKTLNSNASAKRSEATSYMHECIDFISANLTTYGLFNTCGTNKGRLIHKLNDASRL